MCSIFGRETLILTFCFLALALSHIIVPAVRAPPLSSAHPPHLSFSCPFLLYRPLPLTDRPP